MLPTYVSSAVQEKKMNRHPYGGANGFARGSSPLPLGGERGGGFSIRPDKYEK